MKTFKFILLTLLLMCGLMAHAQKVVVYKTDGTKVEYNASEVKDVKYKKAEVVCYWYLSTVKPTSEDDIKTSGTTSLSYDLASRVVLKALSNDGDVNNDGKVDIQDVSTLVKKILDKE